MGSLPRAPRWRRIGVLLLRPCGTSDDAQLSDADEIGMISNRSKKSEFDSDWAVFYCARAIRSGAVIDEKAKADRSVFQNGIHARRRPIQRGTTSTHARVHC